MDQIQEITIKNKQKKNDKSNKPKEVWIDNRFLIRKKISKGSFG